MAPRWPSWTVHVLFIGQPWQLAASAHLCWLKWRICLQRKTCMPYKEHASQQPCWCPGNYPDRVCQPMADFFTSRGGEVRVQCAPAAHRA